MDLKNIKLEAIGVRYSYMLLGNTTNTYNMSICVIYMMYIAIYCT